MLFRSLALTHANLIEDSGGIQGITVVGIFTGVSVATGGTIGTSTNVFKYRFFYATTSSNGMLIGYRSGNTSTAGRIQLTGGYDDGSTTYQFNALIAVTTAGKCTLTAASYHKLQSSGAPGTAVNVTALYGIV